jgi:hypothetical protein
MHRAPFHLRGFLPDKRDKILPLLDVQTVRAISSTMDNFINSEIPISEMMDI